MSNPVTLREFKGHELLFDADETRAILKFIFESKAGIVGSMGIDDRVRSFAQALEFLQARDRNTDRSRISTLLHQSDPVHQRSQPDSV